MTKERTYIIILSVLIFGFVLVQVLQPKPIDWSESFTATDKIPYGTYLIHNLLEPVFPEQEITINDAPIFEYTDISSTENWIFINTSFNLDQWETEKLLHQVQKGSNLFIAARNYGGHFADTLNLETLFGYPILIGENLLQDDTSYVNFTNPTLKKDAGWPYLKSTTETYFSSVDSSKSSILGFNNEQEPNFVKVAWGDGNIFLHSNPTLFTNYFVRDSLGADYAQKALSYLPVQPVIWDEYYKESRRAGGSPLRYIVSEKHLRWAWFLTLSGVILFFIFRAKRKQRIIPVIKSPTNSSIEFAKTIGNLYLEKGNHKLIADKKIRFFFDYIRRNLGLDTDELDQTLQKNITNRSGIDEQEVKQLFDIIENISQKENISERELKYLTERIDRFYNKSQR